MTTAKLNCGECLWHTQDVTPLDQNGKCPRCGADYGTNASAPDVSATPETDVTTSPTTTIPENTNDLTLTPEQVVELASSDPKLRR